MAISHPPCLHVWYHCEMLHGSPPEAKSVYDTCDNIMLCCCLLYLLWEDCTSTNLPQDYCDVYFARDYLRLYITPLAVYYWLRGKDERRRNPKFFTMNHKTFLPADCLLDYTKSMKNESLMVRHICKIIIS
ncbi:hypothetical protein EYC80_009489 [Monilinia laxa]|uniref:Uncharacterized protein n=1 Tax=Monilinia laxa TaxID=61186 RepID=A0A5N6JYE3_MONLA|nr:hypothetical protein EYC80_009489 [Monilinia laxa]